MQTVKIKAIFNYAGGVMAEKLTAREEEYCKAFILHNGDKTAAWKSVHTKSKAKISSQYVEAHKVYKNPKILLRIEELKAQAAKDAEAKFSITVEQRLKWLKEITEAGLGEFIDAQGNKRRENLSAARAAVATMNDMLGVSESDHDKTEPLEIKFTVSAAKGKIETTNVERD